MNRLFRDTFNKGGHDDETPRTYTRPLTDAQLAQRAVLFDTENSQQVMYDGFGNKTWFIDTTGGNTTITLPAANADLAIGITFAVVRKTGGANTLTIAPVSGNIEGSVTAAMPTQYDFRQYRSDGTDYYRVA